MEMMYSARKTIIIGLGNPILGDDGVGWRVAEEISNSKSNLPQSVDVDCLSVGGLALMEHMAGYDQAILIDALQTGSKTPGTVLLLSLDDLPDQFAGHLSSTHDVNLVTALNLGREMGLQIPNQIIIIGIEAKRVYDFSEEMSTDMKRAIPKAVELIHTILTSHSIN